MDTAAIKCNTLGFLRKYGHLDSDARPDFTDQYDPGLWTVPQPKVHGT